MLQIITAVIFIQTLFFKFSAATESVYIFSSLGVEPWGRWLTGLLEALAVVLLLVPSTAAVGALLSLAVISGAILSHLTILGIVIHDIGDNGTLFMMALVVALASGVILYLRRSQIPFAPFKRKTD